MCSPRIYGSVSAEGIHGPCRCMCPPRIYGSVSAEGIHGPCPCVLLGYMGL